MVDWLTIDVYIFLVCVVLFSFWAIHYFYFSSKNKKLKEFRGAKK